MLLVWGVMRFGLAGVLLAVAVPVNTWAVPVVATLEKGRLKVRRDAVAAVLETLIMSWFVDVLRTTLQKTVPVLEGSVLGRY